MNQKSGSAFFDRGDTSRRVTLVSSERVRKQSENGKKAKREKFFINAVGSTATKAAWQVKLELEKQLGSTEVFDNISFVCMDAAAQQSSKFEPGREFLHLAVHDVEGVMRNLAQHSVLNRELPGLKSMPAVAKICDGVNGQPIFGAFALLKNARLLTQTIATQLARLGGNLTIIHLVSPLGGVAPGALIREVYLLRDLCRDIVDSRANHHICFLMLPVKGEQSKSSDREELIQIRNFYFALRQIETFTTPGQTFTTQLADNRIITQSPVFDVIIGLGPNVQRDRVAADLAELEWSAASTVSRYISCGLDETFRQRMADHKTLITGQVRGRNRRLAVGGQITVVVPLGEIHRALAIRSVLKVAEEIAHHAGDVSLSPKDNDATGQRTSASNEIGPRVEAITNKFTKMLKRGLRARPQTISFGHDPATVLADQHNDLVAELNIALEATNPLRIRIPAKIFRDFMKQAPRGNLEALQWWENVQSELERKMNVCMENSKAAKQSAHDQKANATECLKKATRLLESSFCGAFRFLFGVFRPEPHLNTAVDSVYRSRDKSLEAAAEDASASVFRDLASEVRRRRGALVQLARSVSKRSAKEEEPFSEAAPQTIQVVEERHLDTLESVFTVQYQKTIVDLEERFGPMINWGLGFADRVEEFHAQLLETQLGQFSVILQSSAVEYLAGPLADALDIDGASVIASARDQLTTSANYSLAAIPDEDELPEVLLASFAASKDEAINVKMQQILELRENCIQKQGHPEQIMLMCIRFGATLGMLNSATKWRNSFRRALELEGDDVLQIFADRNIDNLGEPVFD